MVPCDDVTVAAVVAADVDVDVDVNVNLESANEKTEEGRPPDFGRMTRN